MSNKYYVVEVGTNNTNLNKLTSKGRQNSTQPHQNTHWALSSDGTKAILQGEFTNEELEFFETRPYAEYIGDYVKNLNNVEVINNGFTFSKSKLIYRSIDAMKYTKDNLKDQVTDAFIESYCSFLKANFNITHIAISIPLDITIDFTSEGVTLPSPRTIENYTQKWASEIHKNNLNVLWRGTFCGIEGIYDFTKRVGPDRETTDYWIDKISKYITNNPNYFADGDLWGILPERSEGLGVNETSFLPYADIQQEYESFFNNLKTTSRDAFNSIGKNVYVGFSGHNWYDIQNSWIPENTFENIVAFDHYGVNRTVNEMQADYDSVFNLIDKPMFHMEWSDYWNELNEVDRLAYLTDMYDLMATYVASNKLIGFNYWGGWDLSPSFLAEGLLTNSGTASNPIWSLNPNATPLQEFYNLY